MNPSGIILIDKRPGFTSAQVVGFVKRKLKLNKVGHAGTLDPLASGLLVLLVGDATKLSEKCMKGRKHYTGTFLFGATSNTDDADGEVVQTNVDVPSADVISEATKKYVGVISQTPPNFSAIKIAGRKAYDIARSGEEKPKLEARSIEVFAFNLTPTENSNIFNYSVECSSGTYVRSLARDLGDDLKCGGLVQTLRREASAPFNVKDAKDEHDVTVEDIVDPKLFLN